MVNRMRPANIFFVSLVAVAGCSYDVSNPAAYPFKLTREATFEYGRPLPVDLDGDGVDELISLTTRGAPDGATSLFLQGVDGTIRDQDIVPGRIAAINGQALIADVDFDGMPDVVVPWIRRDTLFASVFKMADRSLESMQTFAVTTGTPRAEPAQTYPWDPGVHAIDAVESRIGMQCPVVTISAGHARYPRGLFIFDRVSLTLIDSVLVGATVSRPILMDTDGDGELEFLTSGLPSKNGAVAGGMNDSSSYAIQFGLSPSARVLSSFRAANPGDWTHVAAGRTETGETASLVIEGNNLSSSGKPATIHRFPKGLLARSDDSLPTRFGTLGVSVIDFDNDHYNEIAVSYSDGTIELLDDDLTLMMTRKTPFAISRLRTLRRLGARGENFQTGRDDISGLYVVFDDQLRPVAIADDQIMPASIAVSTVTPRRLLSRAAAGSDSFNYNTVRLESQRLYLWFRWNRELLVAAILIGTVLLALHLRNSARDRRALTSVFDSQGSAVMHIASGGRPVRALNPIAAGLLGRPSVTLVQLSKRWPELSDAVTRAFGSSSGTARLRIRGPNGESVTWDASIGPGDPKSRGSLAIRLVPEHANAGDGKPQSWRRTARRVVHDIRTPLSTVRIAAFRLQQLYYGPDRNEASAIVDKIVTQAAKIDNYATDFLRTVDEKDLVLQAVDVVPLLSSLVNAFASQQSDEIDVSFESTVDAAVAMLDVERMASVFENILAIAAGAVQHRGRILVSLGLTKPPAELDVVRGDCIRVQLIDSGAGLTTDILARVFEPGFTTKSNGMGYGLSIARRIVEDHGGHIAIESEEGVGTEVSIYLPML